jgi:para-aminobenzoate synthetase / 4-amino-4-deoxychorismate lyase
LNVSAWIRHADSGHWLAMSGLLDVLQAATPAQVPTVIAAAEEAAAQRGLYAVGFLTFEAAGGFEPKHVTHPPGRLPPAWFALFAHADDAGASPAPATCETPPLTDLAWQPSIDAAAYCAKVAAIRRHIAAGDSYQVNLTYRLRAPLPARPGVIDGLFQTMIRHQPDGYGALIETDDWALCSASHELFFSRHGRRLTSRPMKGTAPRGASPAEDAERARWLRESVKNQAENLMITDMVRNDLGRLADVGSVSAGQLFQLEAHPTLWQMTSTVAATADAPLAEVFGALFPAASITGAPKRRTMEIIRDLESEPREIYTGAIGIIEPGGDAQFSVAIRTAWVDKRDQRIEYGVGGGIVWDSDATEEYQETLTKSRILTPRRAPASASSFSLLETLRWERPSGYALMEQHLQRLRRSAEHFGRRIHEHELRDALARLARQMAPMTHRIRLLVDGLGRVAVEAALLDPDTRPARVVLAAGPAPVLDNPFVLHKTTHRELYDDARRAATSQMPEADDVLLLNARGEVTEATIANVVVDLDGRLFTPPVACGLLPGVYRQHLVETGLIGERILLPADVRAARAVYLVNSLRGMWRVTLL